MAKRVVCRRFSFEDYVNNSSGSSLASLRSRVSPLLRSALDGWVETSIYWSRACQRIGHAVSSKTWLLLPIDEDLHDL